MEKTELELTFLGMLRILVFTAFSVLFILLVGYLPSLSLFFLMGDSPIDCKLSFKDCIAMILANSSISSLSLSLSSSFCLFDASHFSFDIYL
jgi:hypothetical protein